MSLRSNVRRVATDFFGKFVIFRKMKSKLAILPALILVASLGQIAGQTASPETARGQSQVAAPQGIERPASKFPSGEAFISTAIDALARHRSVTAKIRLRIDLFGAQLVGSGSYVQGPSSSRLLKLQLRIPVADQACSLQQVCDGGHLWTFRQMLGDPTVERLNVDVIRQARWEATGQPPNALGNELLVLMGGVPGLLQSLDENFDFEDPQQKQVHGLDVLVARGQWKPHKLARLLPDQSAAIRAGGPVDLSKLQDVAPDHVEVYLGRDDFFPYVTKFLRSSRSKFGRRQIVGATPLTTMEWFDVRFDVPLRLEDFSYRPGNLAVTDKTRQYLLDRGWPLTALENAPNVTGSAATTNSSGTRR